MEILNNIVDIISCLIESFLSLYVAARCLGKTKIKERYLVIIFYILMFIQSRYLQDYFVIQTGISVFLITIFCYKVLESKLINGLLTGIFINLGYGVISISYISMMSIVLHISIEEMMDATTPYYILVIALVKLTELLAGLLIANFVNKLGRFKFYQWFYIIFFYASIFLGVCLTERVMFSNQLNSSSRIIIVAIMMILIISNIATLILVSKMNKDNNAEIENQLLSLQVNEQTRLVERTSELYEEARTLRHDLKHYFVTMSEMLKNGETDEVIEQMQKITNTKLAKIDIVNISNGYLNAAINSKLSECYRNKIKNEILISGTIPEILSMDVVIMLMNLFDNAIEAEKKVDETKRFIRMALQQDEGTIMLEIANYIEESVLLKNGELKSSKKDNRNHGMGIKSVRKTVEKFEGYINVVEKDSRFIVTVMLPIENSR